MATSETNNPKNTHPIPNNPYPTAYSTCTPCSTLHNPSLHYYNTHNPFPHQTRVHCCTQLGSNMSTYQAYNVTISTLARNLHSTYSYFAPTYTVHIHPSPSQNPNVHISLDISHCATISPPHCPTFNIPNPTFRTPHSPTKPGFTVAHISGSTCAQFNLTTSQFQLLHEFYIQNAVLSHPHTQFIHASPSQNPNVHISLHISHCAQFPLPIAPHSTFRIYYNNKFKRKKLTNTPKLSPTGFDLPPLSPSVLLLNCVAPFVCRRASFNRTSFFLQLLFPQLPLPLRPNPPFLVLWRQPSFVLCKQRFFVLQLLLCSKFHHNCPCFSLKGNFVPIFSHFPPCCHA